MREDSKTAKLLRKAADREPVKIRELGKDHSQRKAGYRWMVESRIGGKRKRRFFRYDEATERDQFIKDEATRFAAVAKSDRVLMTDEVLLKEAAFAHKALQPYGKTVSDAVRFYVAHLDAMAKHDATTLSTVAARFLDEKERERDQGLISAVHYADLKNRIARFEIDFGDKAIAGIDPAAVKLWIDELPLSIQSRINFRRVLRNLFAFAENAGNVAANPLVKIKIKQPRRKRAVILTPEEVEKLLNASPATTLPALVLMVFCGVRNREMFRLDWSAVDWEDSTFEITPEQGKREGHARHVTIPANALEWLRPYTKKRGRIADFRDFDEYTRRLQDARALAGWSVGDWPANALRKTFISCHYETHGSIDETAKQAGTSPSMIHAHYRKLIKKRDAEKLWDIIPTGAPKNLIPFKPARKTKAAWPAPDELQAMLWARPSVEIAAELGVSDVALTKHAKRHGLTKPPRGYWSTKEAR